MTKSEIAESLRKMADHIERTPLGPAEEKLLGESVLPALGFLLNRSLDFFAVIALGDELTVSDWINTSEAPFYEVSGRLHSLATTMENAGAQEEDRLSHECEHCRPEEPPRAENKDVN